MRSIPLYAPDGLMTAGRGTERFVGTAAHDRDDDGLVHNHAWAKSGDVGGTAPRPSNVMFPTMPFSGSPKMAVFHRQPTVSMDDRHDDGLVHNHEWAVSGK